MRALTYVGLFAFAGCASSGTEIETIDVRAPNQLGVTTLEIDRFATDDASVFELHGLDASAAEVGVISLRIGTIPDLGGDGTQVTSNVMGEYSDSETRELSLFDLYPDPSSALERLTSIPEVSTALEGAHIRVHLPSANPELPDTAQSCGVYMLLTTPVAQQCCYQIMPAVPSYTTVFYAASTQKIVKRNFNPTGASCKASDGVSSCSGSGCFYGPIGFARPVLSAPPTPYWRIESPYPELQKCVVVQYSSPQGAIYPNVTGNNTPGQGCPGGASGAGDWDYL